MERELAKLGEDAAGYWAYLEYSRKLYRFAEEAYLEKGSDTLGEILEGHGPLELAEKTDIFRTVYQGVAATSATLTCATCSPSSPSTWAPRPTTRRRCSTCWPTRSSATGCGTSRAGCTTSLAGYQKLMGELGVGIHLGVEVVQILKRGSRVEGIVLADGTSHRGDVVVSNMEVIPAYRKLLGEGGFMLRRYEYMFEPAASGLVIHLGVDRTYPQLAHHNFFFSRDPKAFLTTIHRHKRLPDDPTIYLVCPTRTDPALAPTGCDIIKALPHIPYLQDPPFSAADYQALEERVLDKLERMGLEGLRRHTVVKDVLTPEDLERMYNSNKGAIYGVVSDRRKNFALKAPKRSEKYSNLYFVGGSVNPGGGTCMVVLSGQNVARKIVAEQA